ncbi:hypothetical protein OG884_04515 [Streptosporangium sp. NBC_01755]|uniref:hypothetical protein n=1 Tax=unclassified Streptosporangium TaxID=2632669 RepID=UPI002DDB1A20|nr:MULTISPECIES: hypothetical protein [unclassified Streptosporangium]WSA27243.1 hypothetical protein OIE13_05015 [Streptosporangium sp. NBC_01810]WSD01204.1 hypothetical protein OG884_04515 [Streptosporangium sp. NBC_01755]
MKRIAIGLLSAAVSGSLLMSAGTASAERVALSVRIDSVNPNPVVVTGDDDTRVTIEVRTTEATRVELRLKPVSDQLRTQDARKPRIFHQGDLWRFTTSFDASDFEGRWVAIADAYNKDGKKVTDEVNFSVKHEKKEKAETRVYRFSADPNSVRKGRSVYFTGRLQVDDHYWKGARGEEVEIYFRKRGSSAWKYVTSADTGWKGTFRAKARATKSGEYRAIFDGTDDLSESRSRSDWVRVYSYHR